MNNCEIKFDWSDEDQVFIAYIDGFKELQNFKAHANSAFRAQLSLAELFEEQKDRRFIPILIGLVRDNSKPIFQEVGLTGLCKFYYYPDNQEEQEDKNLIKSFLEEFKNIPESKIIKEIIQEMLEEED